MKDNEINIAIAESCGWKWNFETGAWHRPDGSLETRFDNKLPDYANDLNACHEIENTFLEDPEKWNEYVRKVHWIVSEWVSANLMLREQMVGTALHASARQRCEAFLKTLGKWKE